MQKHGLKIVVATETEDGTSIYDLAEAETMEGAMAFLSREYRMLSLFVAAMFVVLAIFIDLDVLGQIEGDGTWPKTAVCYLIGAIGSAMAGFIGMSIAIRANSRTAVKASEGLNGALKVAFSSGAVMGVSVVGIGLLGVVILYWIFQWIVMH